MAGPYGPYLLGYTWTTMATTKGKAEKFKIILKSSLS